MDWARGRKGFIFDELHRAVKAGATASKRQRRLLDAAGVRVPDRPGVEVFHGLRHAHKDWLRSRKIADRTIDLQSGHALEGVAREYGAKDLTDEEVAELAACEPPEAVKEALEASRPGHLNGVT